MAISAYQLTRLPKEITADPPGIRNRVHIRLQTTDPLIYSEILLRGAYAFDFPFSPKIIVDAGANIGMASIYFTHRYPKAKIIAVEPETSNFAALVKNVRAYSMIIPIHAALWNRDGEVSVSEPGPGTGISEKWGFVTHEGAGLKVRAITMQTLIDELGIRSVDLLKVNIEGAEIEVFQACAWIQEIRGLMIELHDGFRPGCSEAVDSVMQGFSKLQRDWVTVYIRQI